MKNSRVKLEGSMNIIIVGCGKIGENLAEQLNEPGNNITVVDLSPERVREVAERCDVMGVVGNGATHATLLEAGIEGADLLIAADCTAYAYGSLHNDFMKGRITMIGCPKLDAVDYTEKLTRIFTDNRVRSVTVVRMEVPCCSALERAARNAVAASGREIPYRVAVITTDGKIWE